MAGEVWQHALQLSGAAIEVMSSKHNIIPEMEWERKGAAAITMTVSQYRFFLCFIAAVYVGAGIRLIRSPTREFHNRQCCISVLLRGRTKR
jgi:hypothetical protein